MPSSQVSQISSILRVATLTSPTKILDVGIGLGRYGFLLADIFDEERLLGGEKSKSLILDGIEAHDAYIGPVHDLCYDTILRGDLRKLLPQIGPNSYDLVILVDVIEHVPEGEVGPVLLELRRVGKTAVVSTPHVFFPQGRVYGNEYERHLSHPKLEHLREFGFNLVLRDRDNLIAVSSADQLSCHFCVGRPVAIWLVNLLPATMLGSFRRFRHGQL